MKEEITIITYPKLLDILSKSNCENNLLLGNGFNLSLGVKTDYSSIIEKMKEENTIYKKLNENETDIEKIIGDLKSKTEDDFLKKFINDKIKLDFMKTTSSIVKGEIKNIYQEKNEGIHLLFKNFTNYFTLNYDPLLYLLLMNFKNKTDTTVNKNEKQIAISFGNTFQFKHSDLTTEEKNIYKIIKEDYEKGKISFNDEDKTTVNIGDLKKSQFSIVVKTHLMGKNIQPTDKNLKKLSDLLWEEKKGRSGELNFNDGFSSDLFETQEDKTLKYKKTETQNLFFLHGTFSFYQKGKEVFKITSKQDKALYERLEEIINNEDEDILCIFKDKGKLEEIKKSEYLNNAYEKLKQLKGSIVILGSAFSENDQHIFEAINESQIKNVYISCYETKKNNTYKTAKECLSNKNIVLFDINTISYSNIKK